MIGGPQPGPAGHVNIGDTVEVRTPTGFRWRAEVLAFVGPTADGTQARLRCVSSPSPRLQPGDLRTLPVHSIVLERVGDPDGMRADGCDDVNVTGRVRPYHRHAVTGEAHAHPNGGEPHTHTHARVQVLPAGDHSLRDELHRTDNRADPVGRLAHRLAWTGDQGSTERSIRDGLADIQADGWHLVRYETGGDGHIVRSDNGIVIAEEWWM